MERGIHTYHQILAAGVYLRKSVVYQDVILFSFFFSYEGVTQTTVACKTKFHETIHITVGENPLKCVMIIFQWCPILKTTETFPPM